MPLQVVIIGPTACGKGKESDKIAAEFGLKHISIGHSMREKIRTNDALPGTIWSRAKPYVQGGRLVPSSLACEVMKLCLNEDGVREKGFVLDGFPRTIVEAEFLVKEGILDDCIFIQMNASDKFVNSQTWKRRVDPETGTVYNLAAHKDLSEDIKKRLVIRYDDTADVTRKRLLTYKQYLPDVMEIVAGKTTVHEVEADCPDRSARIREIVSSGPIPSKL